MDWDTQEHSDLSKQRVKLTKMPWVGCVMRAWTSTKPSKAEAQEYGWPTVSGPHHVTESSFPTPSSSFSATFSHQFKYQPLNSIIYHRCPTNPNLFSLSYQIFCGSSHSLSHVSGNPRLQIHWCSRVGILVHLAEKCIALLISVIGLQFCWLIKDALIDGALPFVRWFLCYCFSLSVWV